MTESAHRAPRAAAIAVQAHRHLVDLNLERIDLALEPQTVSASASLRCTSTVRRQVDHALGDGAHLHTSVTALEEVSSKCRI